MAIISISRGTFSGGNDLAACLGKRLGYEVISREVVAEAAQRYGVPESKLLAAIEKGPSLWDRFLRDRRLYVAIIQAALCEHVARDNVVYHGHAGHLLLQGVKHVLRVRLIAPLDYRIRQVVQRQGMAEEDAVRHIEKVDRERAAWTRNVYGVDWQDPKLYDMVLSLERIDLELGCDLVAAAAAKPQFTADAASRQAMNDLLLASRVRALLAADASTAAADVEVRAVAGVVEIEGKIPDPALVDAVLAKARANPGVTEVRYGTRVMLQEHRGR